MHRDGADTSERLLSRLDELERELQRVQHALDHHERLATLGTIAGLIAHEFNNILTPVLSYAQMALAHPEDRDLASKAIHRAADGAERASRIAQAILGFARDDSRGGPGPARSTWNISAGGQRMGTRVRDAIQDALACMGRDLAQDRIDLDLRVDPELTVPMRPLPLQHLLLNLILNARGAMLPLGGRLAIEAGAVAAPPHTPPGAGCSRRACSTWNMSSDYARDCAATGSAGCWVTIRVRDTGRGMRPEVLARVFEPFFTRGAEEQGGARDGAAADSLELRRDPAGSRRGTGLGMTMCKRLAEEVGGYLIVESAVGQGTCVTLALPAAGGTAAEDGGAPALRKSA